MFRYAYVGGLVIALFLLFSCQSEQPTAPETIPSEQVLNVQISELDRARIAREGEPCTAAFDVLVTDDSDSVVPDVPVTIVVESGPGEVAPEISVTDSSGVVKAVYFVIIPYGDTTAIVSSAAGQDTARASIDLHGDPLL